MPTATPFKALGRGNGFATCPSKIDVNDRGDGNPYTAYKVLTLAEAMHLYWNLASVTATASAPGEDGTLLASLTSSDVLKQPNLRGCDSSIRSLSDYDSDDWSYVSAQVQIPYIYRLYDGSTSSEANFLGYGIDTIAYVYAEYLVSEFIYIFYTGISTKDVNLYTVTDVTVGGITILKEEYLKNNQNVSASISDVGFYTY